MLASAILLSYAFALQVDPALDQKVTFSCPASSASIAVGLLSKQTGVPLKTLNPTSGEMLVLRFNGVPLRVAMEKIAGAATGEWTHTETGYELARPTSLIHALEHEEHMARLARLKKAIGARLRNLGAFDANSAKAYFESFKDLRNVFHTTGEGLNTYVDTPTQDYKKWQKLEAQKPSERLTSRMLAGFDLDALANLPSGQRIVFANWPTAMQRPMGSGIQQALQMYVHEQNVWSKAAAAAQPQIGEPVGNASDSVSVASTTEVVVSGISGRALTTTIAPEGFQVFGEEESITRPIGKVLAIITADWDSGSFEIRFKICDAAGKVMSMPNSSLNLNEPMPGDDRVVGGNGNPVPETAGSSKSGDSESKDDGKTIALSPLARELQVLMSAQGESGDTPSANPKTPASGELRKLILHPEESEPLALLPSEPILKSAEAKDVNVAICIDDQSFRNSADISGKAGDVLALLAAQLGKAKFEKGWLTGTPANPLRPQRESRRRLGDFLRNSVRMGRVALDPLAAYAQEIPDYSASLGYSMAGILVGDQSQSVQANDWLFLRLFGTLDQTQRALLAGGGKLPLQSMTGRQQEAIAAIVYRQEADQDTSTEEEVTDSSSTPDLNRQRMIMQMMESMSGSLITEPTELLPNGLVPGITLAMTGQNDQVVFVSSRVNEAEAPSMPVDIDTLGMMLFSLQNKDLSPFYGQDNPMQITGYKVGTRQTFNLTLSLPSKCSDSGSLSDAAMAPGPMAGFDKLPADVQKQLNDKIEETKKAFQDFKPQYYRPHGQGDNRVPPPR